MPCLFPALGGRLIVLSLEWIVPSINHMLTLRYFRLHTAPLPNGGLGEEEVEEVLRMRQTPDLYKRLAER